MSIERSVETVGGSKGSEESVGMLAGQGITPAASLLPSPVGSAQRALARHWPEYLMEAAGLGLFMLSACLFTVLLEHPGSAAHQALPDPLLRRALIGVAMGLTAVAIIYSPFGKRSGAHLNPSVTFTFWRLGKIEAGTPSSMSSRSSSAACSVS